MKVAILLTILVAFAYSQSSEIVPALATLSARYRATGNLQINCTGAGTVSGPLNIQSTLTDLTSGAPVGNYTSQGFFNNDGSFTVVSIPNINSTSNAPNLTNFLAVARRVAGDRIFDRIVFITRYDTQGGTADASVCTADNIGLVRTVDFSATYGFYRAAEPSVQSTPLLRTYRAVGNLQLACANGVFGNPSGIDSVLSTVDTAATRVGIYNGSFVSDADGSATRTVSQLAGSPVNNALGFALASFAQTAQTVAGSRLFDNIGFITRYDTVGGVATPAEAAACASGTITTPLTKTFEATYGFYQALAGSSTGSSSGSSTGSSTGTPSSQGSTGSNGTTGSAVVKGMSVALIAGMILAAF